MNEIREKVADLCHKQWSGWMLYLFQKGKFNKDGTFTISKLATERWSRQSVTEYKDLSEEEKELDRIEADKFIKLFGIDENKLVSAATHRPCHSAEHDPNNGKIHGWCMVCGIPWPCETAKTFLF